MDITVTITDADWEEFKEVAKDAVETKWNSDFQQFAMYIMAVNIETYVKAQKRKQEKEYQRSLRKEKARVEAEERDENHRLLS